MGTLNMHELAFGITSSNSSFGFCRNPYNSSRIPGGSSGGSGAAAALGKKRLYFLIFNKFDFDLFISLI
jgi:Asp-tRNA(Asn)/Glu-tRNA(Gln) amidotransferase A subunit family amidase